MIKSYCGVREESLVRASFYTKNETGVSPIAFISSIRYISAPPTRTGSCCYKGGQQKLAEKMCRSSSRFLYKT